MEIALTYRHRAVTQGEVVFIRQLIAEHPQASRWALSKKLCQAWNWVQTNGALRDMVCRGLMLELHREGLIELPPVRRVMRNPLVERKPRAVIEVDELIGWSPQARLKNIRLLAYNSRYLIMPWVKVEHLASHLLGRMAKVLSLDWQRVYGHPIYYLETFIDPQRFRGTCYRAANWQVLGVTTGRGKDAPTHRPNRPIKEVLGYPLVKDFRARLGAMA
jgi:hypothetical protein